MLLLPMMMMIQHWLQIMSFDNLNVICDPKILNIYTLNLGLGINSNDPLILSTCDTPCDEDYSIRIILI